MKNLKFSLLAILFSLISYTQASAWSYIFGGTFVKEGGGPGGTCHASADRCATIFMGDGGSDVNIPPSAYCPPIATGTSVILTTYDHLGNIVDNISGDVATFNSTTDGTNMTFTITFQP